MSIIVDTKEQKNISQEVLLMLAEKTGQTICGVSESIVEAIRGALSCQTYRFVAKSEECEDIYRKLGILKKERCKMWHRWSI